MSRNKIAPRIQAGWKERSYKLRLIKTASPFNKLKENFRVASPGCLHREEVFMEGPLEPNMGPSLADVLLCTFESTNAGFSSFPLRKLLSWE